jgi:hypothetical protein
MGRLRSTESRQARHDAAVLRDLLRCRDDKGRLDLSQIPQGRRGRLLRHMKAAARAWAAATVAERRTMEDRDPQYGPRTRDEEDD